MQQYQKQLQRQNSRPRSSRVRADVKASETNFDDVASQLSIKDPKSNKLPVLSRSDLTQDPVSFGAYDITCVWQCNALTKNFKHYNDMYGKVCEHQS
ncbi:Hypothetical predicted protein [Scomber scombrus]|uniref:Uncharacterized protein n=1 Tax=Scomber scombrus TaxID=13677 RepID=A0AAV1N876_SCOSC